MKVKFIGFHVLPLSDDEELAVAVYQQFDGVLFFQPAYYDASQIPIFDGFMEYFAENCPHLESMKKIKTTSHQNQH